MGHAPFGTDCDTSSYVDKRVAHKNVASIPNDGCGPVCDVVEYGDIFVGGGTGWGGSVGGASHEVCLTGTKQHHTPSPFLYNSFESDTGRFESDTGTMHDPAPKYGGGGGHATPASINALQLHLYDIRLCCTTQVMSFFL